MPETHYHTIKDSPIAQLFWGRVAIENCGSFLFYKKGNKVQHILHQLKYKGNKEIGEFLGKMYGQLLIRSPDWQTIDCIIPIPLHKKKHRLRGYNQSESIAIGLSKGMNIPYRTDVLVRTEFTETQTKKSRFHRWENVKEVFAVENIAEMRGKHLLICDDVLTTGATLEASIQKLHGIPDVKVSVVTLATAQ